MVFMAGSLYLLSPHVHMPVSDALDDAAVITTKILQFPPSLVNPDRLTVLNILCPKMLSQLKCDHCRKSPVPNGALLPPRHRLRLVNEDGAVVRGMTVAYRKPSLHVTLTAHLIRMQKKKKTIQ